MTTHSTENGSVRMEVMPDGPLRVSGPVEIVDSDGNVVFAGEKTAICRCGLSANKPFCDGTHRKEGWSDKA